MQSYAFLLGTTKPICKMIFAKTTQKFLYHSAMVPLGKSMLPSSNEIFDIFPADRVPIIINSPHSGQQIPDYIAELMTPESLKLPDTDLFVDDLYSFARILVFV